MGKLIKSDAALHILTMGMLVCRSMNTGVCHRAPFLPHQHLSHAGRGVRVGSRGENIATSLLLSPLIPPSLLLLKVDSCGEGWLPNR